MRCIRRTTEMRFVGEQWRRLWSAEVQPMPLSIFGRLTLGVKLGIIASGVALVIALATQVFVRQARDLGDKQARQMATDKADAVTQQVRHVLVDAFRPVSTASSGLSALRASDIDDPDRARP